jgi:hypothetical protein
LQGRTSGGDRDSEEDIDMPFDFPKPLTGNPRQDAAALWDALFRIVEQLNLLEEEMQMKESEANDRN